MDDTAEFESWVRGELARSPLAEQGFAELLSRAVTILCRIRSVLAEPERREKGKSVWQRLMKNGRMLKEVNEVLPIAARVLRWVDEVRPFAAGPITVLDLCSGVGYLSLLLSELLEASGPDIVARFVLVDHAWPRVDHAGAPMPHHINPEHLNLPGVWSHEIVCRRYDLKSSSGHRELAQHVLARAPGPVAVLGVHLCGLLSVRAVQLYNDHPRCCFFALKPCCLPDSQLARRAYVWQIGGHQIDARDVCGSGNNRYLHGKWRGDAPKELERATFERWCEHLVAGIDVRADGTKELSHYRLVGAAAERSECHACSCDASKGHPAGAEKVSTPTLRRAADTTAQDATDRCSSSGAKVKERDGGGSHSRHRYQTAFLFAQRQYSPEDGMVSKIGGGPEEQFWRTPCHAPEASLQ